MGFDAQVGSRGGGKTLRLGRVAKMANLNSLIMHEHGFERDPRGLWWVHPTGVTVSERTVADMRNDTELARYLDELLHMRQEQILQQERRARQAEMQRYVQREVSGPGDFMVYDDAGHPPRHIPMQTYGDIQRSTDIWWRAQPGGVAPPLDKDWFEAAFNKLFPPKVPADYTMPEGM